MTRKNLCLLLLLFMVAAITCIAQQNSSNPDLVAKVSYLEKQVAALQQRIDLLEGDQNTKRMDERLRHSSEVISAQDALFSRYLTFFQILLGILAIAVPVLIYLIGILPVRKAYKDLQRVFEKYMSRYQMDQIQEALNNIDSEDDVQRSMAYRYLSNNYHFNFDDKMLARIVSVLPFIDEKENDERNILMYILIKRKSKYADRYYMGDLRKYGSFYCKYFNKVGIVGYLDKIANKLIDNEADLSYIVKWLLTSSRGNFENVNKLINYAEIIQKLPVAELTKAKDHIEQHKAFYKNYPGLNIEDSLLYKIQAEKYRASAPA